LDPKVRQSGLSATARGRISKQGSASGRHALVEASWSVVKAAGPMHSYYQRIRARRGGQVAIVATSRKLACLFWCLLTREEDYAYAQPSLTAKKLRRLELAAGAPKRAGGAGIWSTNKAMREAEQALARQAEAAYQRTVADRQSQQRQREGADATTGRAI
jgi:transposase